MNTFMYLFRSHPSGYQTLSPEQMQQMMQKWAEWRETLQKNGHVHSFGERLDIKGKVVRGKTKAVTDGPFVEVKDFVQGYMLVNANDIEQAAVLAKSCPILDIDGSVEVRNFVSM